MYLKDIAQVVDEAYKRRIEDQPELHSDTPALRQILLQDILRQLIELFPSGTPTALHRDMAERLLDNLIESKRAD